MRKTRRPRLVPDCSTQAGRDQRLPADRRPSPTAPSSKETTPTTVRLAEAPEAELHRAVVAAHDELAGLLEELNTSGVLLEASVLRRLRRCTNEALSLALRYSRHLGPCGQPCRGPALHCPDAEPLDAILLWLPARALH